MKLYANFLVIFAILILFRGEDSVGGVFRAYAVSTADPSATSPSASSTPATGISTSSTTTAIPISTQAAGNQLVASLPQCPFSRWQGEPRYCYECRWCPFRDRSCCEIEDEVDALKAINVSGSDDWDCFITIAHFQQCGRCSPEAKSFVQQTDQSKMTLNYVWDPRNLSIRPCKQACRYIYKQCNRASLLDGTPIIPQEVTEGEFCAPYPELSTPELPCYNKAVGHLPFPATVLAFIMASVCLASSFLLVL